MTRTKTVEKDAVTVGKTTATAEIVELDNVAGSEFFCPAGSDLSGLTVKLVSVGPDGEDYEAVSSLTNAQIEFTLDAGQSIDLLPSANVRGPVKFVCAGLTPDTAAAYVRGKRQT